jgi:sugar phosphate isomerase/epimerase
MQPHQIALQLYTVRRLLAQDLPGTLGRIADIGYASVEIAGVPASEHGRLPSLLADAGLEAVAAHVGLEQLRAGTAAVADWLEALDCSRIVVPSLPDDERASLDGLRRLIGELNANAAELADRGIRLGYHNHASEFQPLAGTTTWEVLLDELAPEIEIELDVFWASVGGQDPVAAVERAGDRVRLLHMKDRREPAASNDGPRDAPAGSGTLDMAAIVAAADAAGVEWFIAEQDEPVDELTDIASALAGLRALASSSSSG